MSKPLRWRTSSFSDLGDLGDFGDLNDCAEPIRPADDVAGRDSTYAAGPGSRFGRTGFLAHVRKSAR